MCKREDSNSNPPFLIRLVSKIILIQPLFLYLYLKVGIIFLSVIIPNYARTFDTMDLLCNSISGLIGYRLYLFYKTVVVDDIELVDSIR